MLCTTGAILAQEPAAGPASGADDQADTGRGQADSTDIIVTAQKREENLQDVPIAITALGTEKLDELQVADFDDYARFVPSISYQTAGPGFSNVYFRGVASGENANHSTSLPSVGTYLDEQPITTIHRRARHPRLRHRPGRGARRAAGHALRRLEPGRHGPDHHQQARHLGLLRRGQCRAEHRRPWRVRLYRRSLRQRADFSRQPRCAWSAGTARTPAISTISRARLIFPTLEAEGNLPMRHYRMRAGRGGL